MKVTIQDKQPTMLLRALKQGQLAVDKCDSVWLGLCEGVACLSTSRVYVGGEIGSQHTVTPIRSVLLEVES